MLHAVAGLLVPTAGTVTVEGADLTALSDRERTRLRRERIGIVFQRFHLLPSPSSPRCPRGRTSRSCWFRPEYRRNGAEIGRRRCSSASGWAIGSATCRGS
nr:hypothetical protein [Natronococcus sp. JC468]